MTIQTSEESIGATAADALVVGVVQGPDGPRPAPGAEAADQALGGTLAATLTALGATGKLEEITRIPTAGRLPAPLIVAVGLGATNGHPADTDPENLRRAAGAAVRSLASHHTSLRSNDSESSPAGHAANEGKQKRRIALALPVTEPAAAEAVALGALLGGYAFRRYRAADGSQDTELTLLTGTEPPQPPEPPEPPGGQPGGPQGTGPVPPQPAVRRAHVLAAAVALVRDLVNTSPADLVPATFAGEAQRVAAASGLEIEVLDEAALAAGGYGGLLGVGKGSAHPPRLVRLRYTHPEATRTVVFAGKGITFDSGGLSLKPPKSMETMKSDMAGAAAVLGALQAVAALRPSVNVVGYLPMAENMPGGGAQRPSDVITIHGGTTVEVLDTDAEGRLVLADALARCAADSPDLIVDVATLTGAQLVALGPRVAGVMGSDDALAAAVADTARRAGEDAWPMPLPEHLRKGLDSTVADIANVPPDRNAGMLVAGLFLREFVPDGVDWVHLDIAGPSFNSGEPYGYTPKGGTGAATRILVQVAEDVADGRLAAG